MTRSPSRTVERIREQLDHPIVDADAHQLEVMPLVLEYFRDTAGSGMADEFAAYLAHARRTFSMTPEERLDTRTPMPVWWPVPAENTLDRATTTLPALLYERMDELGLDFSIVYPGIGLQIVTLPGIPRRRSATGRRPRPQPLLRRHVRRVLAAPHAGGRDSDEYAGGGDLRARVRRG